MKRAKPPKKKKTVELTEVKQVAYQFINKEREKLKQENMDEIMNIVLPTVSLACKDELRLTKEEMERVNKRFERYINYVQDKLVTMDDIFRNLEE